MILTKKERRKKERNEDGSLNVSGLVDNLIASADPNDRMLAATLIAELNISGREDDLNRLINDNDEAVAESGLQARTKLGKGAAIPSLIPLLDRPNLVSWKGLDKLLIL